MAEQKKEYYYDHSTRMHHQRTTWDVEPILEEANDTRNLGTNGWSPERNYRKIGSIPMIFLNEAIKQGINPLDGSPEALKWVRDFLKENPKFMTVSALKTNKVGIIK